MPKQELDGEELFNLALSIVGLVLRDGPHRVKELAEHFGYSEKTIKKAVLTVANSEDVGNFKTHFYLDDDLLESGEVDFSVADARLTEPPVLSKRQVTALASGLDYLASLSQFNENQALAQLREVVGGATTTIVSKNSNEREGELIRRLQKALVDAVSIECEYVNQLGERAVRRIDPLRIEFVSDKHYLRGFCHKNQAVRSFRIDRMMSVEITQQPISEAAKSAEIPEDVFGSSAREIIVKIAAEPEAGEIFWNFPSHSPLIKSDGLLTGEIMVGSLKVLGRHIAKYGGLVRVLEPIEAIVAVREFAQSAISTKALAENED